MNTEKEARLVSLNVGKPRTLHYRGRTGPSAFATPPVEGSLSLETTSGSRATPRRT